MKKLLCKTSFLLPKDTHYGTINSRVRFGSLLVIPIDSAKKLVQFRKMINRTRDGFKRLVHTNIHR